MRIRRRTVSKLLKEGTDIMVRLEAENDRLSSEVVILSTQLNGERAKNYHLSEQIRRLSELVPFP